MNLKEELYNQCQHFVNKRLHTVQDTITSNQKALQSETKSSAGDKHETGRAMLQLEMEKAGQQLSGISLMKETLAKIDVSKTSKVASLGSIIKTGKATYFLSISAGQLTVANTNYFAISVSSPVGKLLLGKLEKETITFNGITIIIEEVL
jgi:transcription elongation GreA/GreB family factor